MSSDTHFSNLKLQKPREAYALKAVWQVYKIYVETRQLRVLVKSHFSGINQRDTSIFSSMIPTKRPLYNEVIIKVLGHFDKVCTTRVSFFTRHIKSLFLTAPPPPLSPPITMFFFDSLIISFALSVAFFKGGGGHYNSVIPQPEVFVIRNIGYVLLDCFF